MNIEISQQILYGKNNYQITREGRVFNVKNGRYRINQLDTHGYYYVQLCDNGNFKNFRIHKLLAEAFIPNHEGKLTVDHLNRIRTDNRLENLRFAT